jgi:hypothetical protein
MVPIAQSIAASMKPSEVVATMDRQSAESWARDLCMRSIMRRMSSLHSIGGAAQVEST